ncbi:MAG: benzoate/H(+) symporter BenE family transporter [Rhodospirillales bacterium]
MLKDISARAVITGLISVLILITSTFAVVIAGLTAVGATPEQAASGMMALMLFYGVAGVIAGVVWRKPIVIAGSTPGAALLISSGGVDGGFAAAIGAFIVAGGLVVLAGIWRPFGRAVGAIPPALSNAMLAGVLFGLCLAPLKAVAVAPWAALPVIFTWLVVGRVKKLMAMPAAAAAAVIVVLVSGAPVSTDVILPNPIFVAPEFTWAGVGVIALPLFIVIIAAQNIPSISVLKLNGYKISSGPATALTGVFSLLAAPFGGHAVCLSSLVIALCSGPEAHSDPARRYWAAIAMGGFAVIFAPLAGLIVALAEAAPPHLIAAVAGLALLGPLMTSLVVSLKEDENHESALIAFIVSASGFVFFDIGAPFWGLLLGGAVLAFQRWARNYRG